MKKELPSEKYLEHQEKWRNKLNNPNNGKNSPGNVDLDALRNKAKKRKFRWILFAIILIVTLALIGAATNIGISNVVSAVIGSIIAAVAYIQSRRNDRFFDQ